MIVAIVGPTGVGKTRMSIALAKHYNAEVVSCDSMQIYNDMNIGTAKVTADEMDGIKHHMINIKDVSEDYSVFDYQKDARNVLDNLLKDGKNIIIVGGTGLYLKALLYNYEFHVTGCKKCFSNKSNEELYNMVLDINPNTDIHINNRQRLESYLNNHNDNDDIKSDKMIYDATIIGLTKPRDELYNTIDNRVDDMIKNGLIEEAKGFYDKKINSKAINTAIGYKELYEYFDNKISINDATNLIKKRSRNYAKRQYTWFNNQLNVKWFNIDDKCFDNTIKEVINYLEKK